MGILWDGMGQKICPKDKPADHAYLRAEIQVITFFNVEQACKII